MCRVPRDLIDKEILSTCPCLREFADGKVLLEPFQVIVRADQWGSSVGLSVSAEGEILSD